MPGDNELEAIESLKHYHLPIMCLHDTDRAFERQYNKNGWPFMLLADRAGEVVYSANGLLGREWDKVTPLIDGLLADPVDVQPVVRDGVPYMPATLERSGETEKAGQCDRFPAIACGPDGRVYLAFTSNRNGNSDVFLRVFDGNAWGEDLPLAATQADEYNPAALVDAQGSLRLAWIGDAEAGHYNVFAATVVDPRAPIEPVCVTDAEDDAMRPGLACDAAGRVWLSYYKWAKMKGISRDKEVYARHTDGAGWSDEIHISPDDVPSYEDHTDPAVAACGDGVIVAWSWDFHKPKGYTQEAHSPTIFVRTANAEGASGKSRAVSGPNIESLPSVAVDKAGRVWCAWSSVDRSGGKSVCAAAFDLSSSETPGAGDSISQPRKNVCTPRLAIAPDGKVTLVWAELDETGAWSLQRADCQDGKWGAPQTLVTEGQPRFPAAAYDTQGRLWVAYSTEDANGRCAIATSFPLE